MCDGPSKSQWFDSVSSTEFDYDNSSLFRLYMSGVPTTTCGVNEVDNSTQRVRAVRRKARRSKQAASDREYISEVDAELQKSSDDILVLIDMNFIQSTSTGGPRGLLRDERLPRSPNLVSTLRMQSTGTRALSVKTSEGQDKIRGLKRETSKRSLVCDVSSWRCDNTSRHQLG